MTPNKIFLYILIYCGFCSCKKSTVVPPDVIYTVSLDGYTVTFTNQTSGASSYKWDFGDGTSSTDQSPVHTYPGKGKYVPTLYITAANGATAEGSTVINISKASSVKLNDNTLSDWDTVAVNAVTPGPGGGIFLKAKFDYNSDYVYFYFEMTSTVANGDIFDFYLDADNNAGTGLLTGTWPGGGYDVLLEGAILNQWLDPYYFSGATQNSWSWSSASIADFYQIGTVVQSGTTLKFEGAFSRSKIKGLTGKGLRLALTATKSDWSVTKGSLPDAGQAPIFLDMSE
jgi:PKD repeat protein